jgi:hypothetical protein
MAEEICKKGRKEEKKRVATSSATGNTQTLQHIIHNTNKQNKLKIKTSLHLQPPASNDTCTTPCERDILFHIEQDLYKTGYIARTE